jgi:PAS domain S-box-containing protein
VALPRTIAFAAVVSRLGWSALFIAATLVLAWGIAWMLSARIVRRLRQLGKDAFRLASGDLAHRATVHTLDEVEALAKTFNNMAESLEQRDGELRKSKNTLAAVIDASAVAIACSNPEHRVILWSRAAEQIFGYSAQEVLGRHGVIIPASELAESHRLFERALNGETVGDIETVRRRKDGTLVDVRIAFAPMCDLDGTVHGVARAYEDITEHKEAEEQLKRIAHYDQLSGLPNRLSLQKQLGRLLAGEGQAKSTGVALFDLDGFKDVNDTLGHPTGDELLIEVARRLASAVGDPGQAETVHRLGGDEAPASPSLPMTERRPTS